MSVIQQRLPGLQGTEHVGITVPDLTQALDFFVGVLGCEPFYELGPYVSDDDWMERHLAVHPRSEMRKLRFLRCGRGPNFEVIEYRAPDQRVTPPAIATSAASTLPFTSTTSTQPSPICGSAAYGFSVSPRYV